MMRRSGDVAGFSVASVNFGVAELLLADLPAALRWLDRALAVFPIPGGHRSLGWLYLLRAHVLGELGDMEGSMISAKAAQTVSHSSASGAATALQRMLWIDAELEYHSLRTAMPIMRPSSREIQISLLGGFSVTIDGEPVPDRWRLRKAKTLVKLLALAPSHRLHRDLVVDRLWPDMEPQLAANNLYQLAQHPARAGRRIDHTR